MNQLQFDKLMQVSEGHMFAAMVEMRFGLHESKPSRRMYLTRQILQKKYRLLFKTMESMRGSRLMLYQLFLAPFLPECLLNIKPILSVLMDYSWSLESHVATSLNKMTFCSLLFQPKLDRITKRYMNFSTLSMAPRIFQIRVEKEDDDKKMRTRILKGSEQSPLIKAYFNGLNQKRAEFFEAKNANMKKLLDAKAEKRMRYRQSLGSKERTTKPNKAEREKKHRSFSCKKNRRFPNQRRNRKKHIYKSE